MFNLRALFEDVDATRRQRDLTWTAVSRQVGVSASTIRRFGEAADAEADGVLAIIRWLSAKPEDYVGSSTVQGKRLKRPGTGYVRVDMQLVTQVSGDRRGARGRTRTTIQRLVEVAQSSGRSVASLTRFSER